MYSVCQPFMIHIFNHNYNTVNDTALNLTTTCSNFTPLEAYSISTPFIMHKWHEDQEENIKDRLGLRTKPAIPNPQDVQFSSLGLLTFNSCLTFRL